MAHTNGMVSFWGMLRRGYHCTYHKFSEKHLYHYVREFTRRHNTLPRDTLDVKQSIAINMAGKRLRYRDLTSANGLSSRARPTA